MDGATRRKDRLEALDRRARRAVYQGLRLAGWALAPQRWPAPELWSSVRHGDAEYLAAEVRLPLARGDRFADPALEAGKRKNLALAAPAFDGLYLAPDRPLSFWRTLGRVTAARGYTWGMEMRGGCVVPALGGGLCLLSNALFEAAARAGFRILERSGHTLEAVPPEPGEPLRIDATLAWPDVDLVIAPEQAPARLEVSVEDSLVVRLLSAEPLTDRIEIVCEDERVEKIGEDRFRLSRLVRRRNGTTVETLGENRKRILADVELGRSCITCGEVACAERPETPVLVSLKGARK
jgi:vancomycin resistance protein VanW